MPVMPWGKWRGHDLADVPSSYLCFVADESDADAWLRAAARQELASRYGEVVYVQAPAPRPMPSLTPPALLAEVIASWFRRLSLDHHPDRGGSQEAMKAVNAANDSLKAMLREHRLLKG